MAYDEELADRIRKVLAGHKGLTVKKMFGGITFLLRGNMCSGVVKRDLVVRVGPEQYDHLLGEPGARLMDFTGRPMKGMIYVGSEGYRSRASLAQWVNRGVSYAASLPPKKGRV